MSTRVLPSSPKRFVASCPNTISTRSNSVQLRDWVNKDAFYAVIESKETGAFMGTTCIWLLGSKNRDGMVAIGLLPIYWNKGYGTEALGWVVDYGFRWLALHRVSLSVFESNKGAIGSYKKM